MFDYMKTFLWNRRIRKALRYGDQSRFNYYASNSGHRFHLWAAIYRPDLLVRFLNV